MYTLFMHIHIAHKTSTSVGQHVDLHPQALRLAEAVDSPELRERCVPGLLYFSCRGSPLQRGLAWDFDGDYFLVIENPKLIAQQVLNAQLPGRIVLEF